MKKTSRRPASRRPTPVNPAAKRFDKGDAGGGKRTSAYTAKPKPKPASSPKRKPVSGRQLLGSGVAGKAAGQLSPKARARKITRKSR